MPSSGSIKSLSEIPTVEQLYNASVLHRSPSSVGALFAPSTSINTRVGIIRADITKLKVDAIVNAANTSLKGGAGVDGAIHQAAGPGLLAECRRLSPCPTGHAKMTHGYHLPAKYVIHAVGPIYDASNPQLSRHKLSSCYDTSLKLAVEKDIKTVAFSCISARVYGYPCKSAAAVACERVRKVLETDHGKLQRVIFVTFTSKDTEAYYEAIPYVDPRANSNDIIALEAFSQCF